MRTIRKIFLYASIVFVVLGSVGLVGLNLYLRSAGFRKQVSEEAAKAIKMPVSIDAIGYTPWGGAVARGVRITEQAASDSAAFLKVPTVVIRIRLLPIFRGRVVIDDTIVESLSLVARQDKDGNIIFPSLPEEPKQVEGPKNDGEPENVETAKPAKKADSLAVEFRHGSIQKGALRLDDAKGRALVQAEDFSTRVTVTTPEVIAGSVEVASLHLEGLHGPLTRLKIPFTKTSESVEIPNATVEYAAGKISLSGSVQMRDGGFPLRGKGSLLSLDLSSIAKSKEVIIGGRLMGDFEFRGDAGDPKSLRGRGRLEVKDGRLDQFPLLQTLGLLLQVPELVSTTFDEAYAEMEYKNSRLRVDQLKISSTNLRLTASGSVKEDQKLDLNARLAIAPAIAERLPESVRKAFEPDDEVGWAKIDFDIRGSVDSPKTNLQDKLLKEAGKGKVMEILGGLLSEDQPAAPGESGPNQPPPLPLPSGSPAAGGPPLPPASGSSTTLP